MEVIMDRKRRGSIAVAVLLILLGTVWLATQLFPDLQIWENISFDWPWIVIGVGVLLLVIGLLAGEPDMAIPACIVGGIGCLLYYQNSTGDWGSWAYAWALIPGFAGLGTILAGLLKGNSPGMLRDGLNMIVVSAVLFVIFGSFLGGLDLLGPYWPLLLILAGLWILFQGFWRRRKEQ
jgi:hypothetical protein